MRRIFVSLGVALLAFHVQAAEVFRLDFVAVPLRDVLSFYEIHAKKMVVVQPTLESLDVSVASQIPMSETEALDFIEVSLKASGVELREVKPGIVYVESGQAIPPPPVQTPRMVKIPLKYMDAQDLLSICAATVGKQAVPLAAGDNLALPAAGAGGRDVLSQSAGLAQQSLQQSMPSLQSQSYKGADNGIGYNGSESVPSEMPSLKPRAVKVDDTVLIADAATRQLCVIGQPDKVEIIKAVVAELDQRPEQIEITAIIGQYDLGNDRSLGVDILHTVRAPGDGGPPTSGTAWLSRSSNPDSIVRDASTASSLSSLLPASAGLTIYSKVNESLSVFANTLETSRRFHVEQRPTITTLNHRTGRIYVGQQVAIAGQSLTQSSSVATSGTSIATTTQYVPVRLQLDVTPHIYEGGEIKLEFTETNNDISGYSTISGNQVPNISEQGLHNIVVVKSGETLVLGGLIKKTDSRTGSGVPVLSRIPVLKLLFGTNTRSVGQSELVILLQPRLAETKKGAVGGIPKKPGVDLTRRF